MTSQLIESSLFDCLSSPSKGQSGVLQITDHSSTKISSIGITGHSPWSIGDAIVSYPSAVVLSAYSTAPADRVDKEIASVGKVRELKEKDLLMVEKDKKQENYYRMKKYLRIRINFLYL